MFGKRSKKKKHSKESFEFTVYDKSMDVIAGINDMEQALALCKSISKTDKDEFYIISDTGGRIFSIEGDAKAKYYRELEELYAAAQRAPYIPEPPSSEDMRSFENLKLE